MSAGDPCSATALTGAHSRRAALHTGGALLAGMGALAFQRGTAAQATPTADAPGGSFILVQSFSRGTLFPTQGDAGGAPYTVIVWDAADRGFFFADCAGGGAGVVPSESVLAGIGAESPARAVLVAAGTEASDSATPPQEVWALRLTYGSLGSDPGAVTYQGEPLTAADAASWLGTEPATLPEGPQDLGLGFLILTGISGFDTGEGVRLNLT